MKAYILPACSTCQRILKEVGWTGEIHDIKKDGIPEKMLNRIAKEHGGFEVLFSRRAMKYKSLGLKEKTLTEEDYKKYILGEYTFLKRPVFVFKDRSFVGNSKKVVQELLNYIKEQS